MTINPDPAAALDWAELRAEVRTVIREARECRAKECPHCNRNEEMLLNHISAALAAALGVPGEGEGRP